MKEKKLELSAKFCLFNGIALLQQKGKELRFGMLDLENEELKERIKRASRTFFDGGETVCQFEKASNEQIEKIVSRSYGNSSFETETEETEIENLCREETVVLLLDSLIEEAVNRGATDIHIEENKVRIREKGLLVSECELNSQRSLELVRRVKLLSKMNVLEKRRGQDGQFVYKTITGEVFVRVSCIPVVSQLRGESTESVVLRLLNPERLPLKLSKLGFSKKQQKELEELTEEKSGLVLICGPTGSGKSTTAASLLELIRDRETNQKKIITVEDPPEYVLKGITQICVNEKSGMKFDDALRFIFRQDPDVIFVGEIRDELSAQITLRAALTGHLVFATVHTDGVEEAVLRLTGLGVDKEALRRILRGIIVQTLDYRKSGEPELKAEICREVIYE